MWIRIAIDERRIFFFPFRLFKFPIIQNDCKIFKISRGIEESQKKDIVPSIEKRGKKERKKNESIAKPKYHEILIVP